MPTTYDRTLDDFAAELAREYLRIFRDASDLSEADRAALAAAIATRDKPAIRRLLGGADARLERAIIDATTRTANKYLPGISSDSAASAALSGMVQSATKALVTGVASGTALAIDIAASSPRYQPDHLLQSIGLTEPQARLYFATIRAAQDIADSIPRSAATADAIQAAARDAANRKRLPASVRVQLAPILKDPRNAATADAAIRRLADKLRAHHAGPAAHVAAHSLIEEARFLHVLQQVNNGKLPPTTLKRWTNPMDHRTRTSHGTATRQNRKGVPVEKPFTTPWGPLMTPPPPGVHAYNCRCRAEYFTPPAKRTTDKSNAQ